MGKLGIDKDLIREIAEVLDETGLTEIEYEEGGKKLRVAKHAAVSHSVVPAPAPAMTPASSPASAQAAIEVQDGPNPADVLSSPMVGTAYTSSEPGAPPFVASGASVSKGQTVMIVEAMKVMNPIKAHKDGVVQQVCVENNQPVEFGEALVVIA